MSILNRLQRIAKANINWFLDIVEPPENELKAKIEELRGAISEGKAAAATYGATYKQLDKEVEALKAKQQEFLSSAEQAVQAGDDALAKKFLKEKVSITERISRLTPGVEEGRKTFEYLKTNLERLQDQLKQANLKLTELQSRQKAADARKVFTDSSETVSSHVNGGAMFERMEDKVTIKEAEAEIAEDMQGINVNLEQQSRDIQIDAELAALKDKIESDN